jgi:capsular polysaccharide biosynthesis protein
VIVTGLVLAVAVISPERYRASARIADEPAAGEPVDIASADRRLATSRELVTAPNVLAGAARSVPGETAASIAAAVTARVDPAASILDVDVSADDPRRAADIANAVAATFLAESARMQRVVATRARERLTEEIARLRRAGAPATDLEALRDRQSELAVDEVMAGSGLRLVQRASPPAGPYAPRPVRSAVLAFVSALLLAMLVAVARDQMRPRVPDAGTLSRILGLPLLAALPAKVSGLTGRGGSKAVDQAVIEEAALQGAVRGALPPRGQRVVLVHAIDREDGAEQVAAALARSLAWGGHATALVRFAPSSGRAARRDAPSEVPTLVCADIDQQLAELKGTDYRYVVVQSPREAHGKLLRPLAAHTAAVVLVARLGVASVADAAAGRRLVDALGLRGLGLVVVCSPRDATEIARTGFAAQVRAPARPRTASRNGHRASDVPELAASEPDTH